MKLLRTIRWSHSRTTDHLFDPAQINGLQKAHSCIGRLPHALHALYSGTNPATVPGFSFLEQRELHCTSPPPNPPELKAFVTGPWAAIDVKKPAGLELVFLHP